MNDEDQTVDPETIQGPLDLDAFLNLAERSYGWTIITNGDIAGLTAGDHGYERCGANVGHIVSHAMHAANQKQSNQLNAALEGLMFLCADILNESKSQEQNNPAIDET